MKGPTIQIDRKYYQRNSLYAYSHTIVPIVVYLFLLGVCRSVDDWYTCVFFVILLGYLQYRMHFPLHDCTHFSLFKTQFENRLWGTILASTIFTTFESFRKVHLKHHTDLGCPEDPGAVDYRVRFESRIGMVFFLLSPLVGWSVIPKVREYIKGFCTIGGSGSGSREEGVRFFLQLITMILVQFILFSWVTDFGQHVWKYATFCILPTITSFLFFSRLRMFIEHGSLDYTELDYLSAPAAVARTIPSLFVERPLFTALNFNYHYEHHRFPQVPSCNLKRLHQEVTRDYLNKVEFENTYCGSLMKLWKYFGDKGK